MANLPKTVEECNNWYKNPTLNPITGRKISEDGGVYKKIKKVCDVILENVNLSKNKKTTDDVNKHYPSIDDPEFKNKLESLAEFNVFKIPEYKKLDSFEDFEKQVEIECPKDIFNKALYQHFITEYMAKTTPYNSVLLYHSVGLGKTCSAVSIAEGFLRPQSAKDTFEIYVILPASLKTNFKDTIYNDSKQLNQCTNDLYYKLSRNNKDEIKNIIKKRYKIFSYENFAKYINANKDLVIENKMIIVDEVHNIRRNVKKEKEIYEALTSVLQNGKNNKLVLMSATPMYNTVEEIIGIFRLILTNEKKNTLALDNLKLFDNNNKLLKNAEQILTLLSSQYVSYISSNNPYSFAYKLKPIDSEIENWSKDIQYGIYYSKIGKIQKEYLKLQPQKKYDENDDEECDDENDYGKHNVATGLMEMNIIYPPDFNAVFTPVLQKPISIKYNQTYDDYLFPDLEHLGQCAPKMLAICNKVKKSQGIVLIYSRFLKRGVIPMAIALEHLGMTRYGVKHSFLDKSVKNITNDLSNLKYAILTSPDPDYTGNNHTSFDDIIKTINDPTNINGDIVKIVLITQKASEGISFNNIREVHVMDPWYHINRIEQIIGRAVRKCSHMLLPINKRNVLIYLHALKLEKNDSYDINAYKIIGKKLITTNIINDIIRKNAFDYNFNFHINNYPKTQFEKLEKIVMITSQKYKQEISFGTDIEVSENIEKIPINTTGLVNTQMTNIIKSLIIFLSNYIKKHKDNWISNTELSNVLKSYYNNNVLYFELTLSKILYPNIVIENYYLFAHNDGIYKIKQDVQKHSVIVLSKEDKIVDDIKEDTIKQIDNYQIKLIEINQLNSKDSLIEFYFYINSINFNDICQHIIQNITTYPSLVEILIKEGLLVKEKEIEIKNSSKNNIIGYINIFNKDEKFEGKILKDINTFEPFLESHLKNIKANRVFTIKPQNGFGIVVSNNTKNTKKEKTFLVNKFKVIRKEAAVGKKTGIVCKTMTRPNIMKEFEINSIINNNKIETLCNELLNYYLNNNKLYFLPEWKPVK